MEDKRYDPYTGYEIKDEDQRQEDQSRYENENKRYNRYNTQQEANIDQQAQTSGIALAAMILGIISVVCMVSCCCTPIAIITGIAAIICFAVTPKVNDSYFARDYGLHQISIEEGGKEPSPAHLKALIDLCQAEDVRVIFVQPEFDKRNAETIAQQTGTKVIPINPLSYDWEEEMLNVAKALAPQAATK